MNFTQTSVRTGPGQGRRDYPVEGSWTQQVVRCMAEYTVSHCLVIVVGMGNT